MREKTLNPKFQKQHWLRSYGAIPEAWSFVPIGSIFNERRENSADLAEFPLYSFTIEKGVTPKTARYERSFLLKDTGNKFSIVYPDDFIFNPMNLRFGAISYSRVKFPVAVSAYYNILIPDQKKVDHDYLETFLRSHRVMGLYDRIAIGSLIEKRRIHLSILNKTFIPLPPIAEQKAIGNILRKWDQAINLTEKLIAEKQQLRKGLMQQLLTGKRRLPGFAQSNKFRSTRWGDYPIDWKYSRIEKIAKHISSKNSNGDSLPVLSCTKHKGLVDSLKYFGKQVFSKDLSTYKVVKRGQFAYATNHIEEGSIGYQNLYDSAVISPMYTVFETNEKINDRFLFLLFKTELYRHIFEVNTNASVNRRGSLRWPAFSRIQVPVPSLEEQQAVVNVIEIVDCEIAILQSKADALHEQKKGLMQQLLTGKKRVKV